MLFVQSGALPSLNIQTVGFKRHLLKERGFYLQDSPMFLIIKKKEGRKAHSFFFLVTLQKHPHGPSLLSDTQTFYFSLSI